MKRSIVFLAMIAIAGCIDPIKLKTGDGGTLVIDGMITDEPGPYVVSLSRSIDFDNSRPVKVFSNPERGAIVTISDNTGFSETLVEGDSGKYATRKIRGTIGNTYTIHIETADGRRYVSAPETMPPVAPIKEVKSEFDVYDHLVTNANGDPRAEKVEGFYIYAVAADPTGKGNFYRWSADGIYEYHALNDSIEKAICWMYVDRLEKLIQVSDDLLDDGKPLKHFVCIVPYDKPWKYLVKMKQYSLTEQAFNYWSVSAYQQASAGSIFDPPPSIIEGNIKSLTDSELALGFFGASAVTRLDYLMDRLTASGFKTPNPNVKLTQWRLQETITRWNKH